MLSGRDVQYGTTFALSLATLTLGVASTWISPAMPMFKNGNATFSPTKYEISWMASMSPPGFLLGSFITRFTSDLLGRKTTILCSALPYACGMILNAFTAQAWAVCVAILFWGTGTGMISTVITIYLAEIADKEIRASLGAATRFMTNFGALLMMSSGYQMSYETLNYCMIPLPVVYFVFCLFIPESPYFYLKEGKPDNAKKVLYKLRQNPEEAEIELELMKADVKKEMNRSNSFREFITQRQYTSAITIAVGLKISQIFTGSLTITQYFAIILKDADMNLPLTTAFIIFACLKFVAGMMSSVFADRIGRRPLLIYSFLGNAFSLITVAIYFFAQEVLQIDIKILKYFSYVPLLGIISSTVVSTLGFNAIIGTVQAEIFPLNVKTIAMTSINVLGGIFGFTIGKSYQYLRDAAGSHGVFWVFAGVSIFGGVFSFYTVPETRGKSLREIQDIMQGVRVSEELLELNVQEEKNTVVNYESREQTKL